MPLMTDSVTDPVAVLDNVNEYGALALRTLAPAVADSVKDSVLNAVTGLSSEAGELQELFAKRNGFDPVHLRKELGDYFWYWSLLAHTYGYTNAEVLDRSSARDFALGVTIFPFGRAIAMQHLVIATGAINEQVKKRFFHVHPYDDTARNRMRASLYDAAMAWMNIVHDTGNDPAEVLGLNIAKLKARYPDGQFTTERSMNRAPGDI
jgi:hypothetical protein